MYFKIKSLINSEKRKIESSIVFSTSFYDVGNFLPDLGLPLELHHSSSEARHLVDVRGLPEAEIVGEPLQDPCFKH